MVRIGILSVAHMHASSYVAAIKSLDNAELVGIYDNDSERGATGAETLGTSFFADPVELLNKVDAVIICSENNLHRHFTELAAKHGKDILCEKPIATTVEDGEAMIKACAEANVRLQIAFPVRFATPIMRVKEMLDQGAVGDVLAIRGTNQGQMPGGWFIDPELSGGGAVMDHTVHVVDVVRWFLGKEVVSVYAEVDNMLYDVEIDDCGMLSMELEDGVIFTQDPSWSRPATFPTWGNVTLEITGTKGIVAVDAFAQHLTVYDDRQNKVRQESFTEDMDLGLIQDFVEMLETGREPSITGYDGLQAMAVGLAAYRSAKLGQPITLS